MATFVVDPSELDLERDAEEFIQDEEDSDETFELPEFEEPS